MVGIAPIEPYKMPDADDLPRNTARWIPEAHRAVLLIHDMQRYFLKPFAAHHSPAKELVDNTVRLRELCTQLSMPVAYTSQPGGMTEHQRGLLKDFWGPGMRVVKGDRHIIRPLAPRASDWMFTKWRYSAFYHSELLARMREHGRDQLIICGVYAHVGVLITAVEAFTNDIQTFVVADAIADFDASYHRLAIEYAAQRCAVVGTTAVILSQLAMPGLRLSEPLPAGLYRRREGSAHG